MPDAAHMRPGTCGPRSSMQPSPGEQARRPLLDGFHSTYGPCRRALRNQRESKIHNTPRLLLLGQAVNADRCRQEHADDDEHGLLLYGFKIVVG